MNELGHSVRNERDGRAKTHSKSGRRGICALTRHSLTLETIFAGIGKAISVNRACVARISQNTRRKKRWLVHPIYGYKKLRHWIFPLQVRTGCWFVRRRTEADCRRAFG